jgi:hypothetical protein
MNLAYERRITMSADLHIHVCLTEEEERHALLWQKKTVWCSEIGNAYTEYFHNGEWIHEEVFMSLSNEEQDKFYDLCKRHLSMLEKEGMSIPKSNPYVRDIPLNGMDEKIIENTKNIWIGEVSWLKAGLFEDGEKYIPTTVMEVSSVVHAENFGLKVIDDELIEAVSKAFDKENITGYRIAEKEKVIKFFTEYKGKKCFQISW